MKAGVVNKGVAPGCTQLLDGQLDMLRAEVLRLKRGEEHELHSVGREYGLLLIRGECELHTPGGSCHLGPRANPLTERPWAFYLGRGGHVRIRATGDCTLGIGSAPCSAVYPDALIAPDQTGGGPRGEGCFAREVRFALWNDNSPGERLMLGETVIPPGHWSSYPPHKHDTHAEGVEAVYEEAYYFEFESSNGFALVRQYDRRAFDQTVCARNGGIAYMQSGYHPVVNGPACAAYQLTLMAGAERISQASMDPDFAVQRNPYQNQRTRV